MLSKVLNPSELWIIEKKHELRKYHSESLLLTTMESQMREQVTSSS